MNTKRYPIDIDSINKGDIIPVSQCEQILREKHGTQEYVFKLLSLKEWIMNTCEQAGNPVTISIDHGSLVIHMDESASDYNDNLLNLSLSRFKRGLKRLLQVDQSKLPEKVSEKHLERCRKQSLTFQGAMLGRRGKLPLIETQRNVPGIESYESG